MIKLKSEWKTAFIYTFIIGLITHGYKITNCLLNHDVLWNLEGVQKGTKFGRPSVFVADTISSFLGNLPWVNGLLSLLYISITAVIIIEIFQINDKKLIFLIAAIQVTFPSTIALFTYIHCTDIYLLGMPLCCLTILIYMKSKNWVCKILLCGGIAGVTIGIYQSYISYFMILIIMVLCIKILNGVDNVTLIKELFGYLAMGLCGVSIYIILYKAALIIDNRSLSDYMGISSVGIMSINAYVNRIKEAYQNFFYFFFLVPNHIHLYSFLNICIIILFLLKFVYILIVKGIYKKLFQILFLFVSAILLPLISYILVLLSEGVQYHRLMEIPLSLIYIFMMYIVLYSEKVKVDCEKKICVLYKYIFIVPCCLLIYLNILAANITYQDMEQSNIYAFNLVNRIVNRIEEKGDSLHTINKLMVVGTINDDTMTHIEGKYPSITGASYGNFLSTEYHYSAILKWYFGYNFELVNEEQKNKILENSVYEGMGSWPMENSVAIIDDVYVIKLDDSK